MLCSFRAGALALALAGVALGAAAQKPPAEDPDWKELDVPAPGPVRTTGLVDIDVSGTSLRFAVDPASVGVGADSIVRYVIVATSPTGTVNAMYEGIRCDKGEVKVYARYNPSSGWVPASRSDWQVLQSTPNSRHSLAVARAGACFGNAPNGSPAQIVQDLRAPITRRFERSGSTR
jgi:hypothetical protein